MPSYSNSVVDDSGYRRPISGVQIYVLNRDGSTASSAVPNPVTTDQYGVFTVTADDGVYDLDYRLAGVTYAKETVTIGTPPQYVGPTGAVGSSDNTYTALAPFKASDIARKTASLVGVSGVPDGRFNWTLGNFTGQADDVNVIKADSTALSVGAWVRQKADGISIQRSTTAKLEPLADAQRRTIDVESYIYAIDADATNGFQRAINDLPNGGVIRAHGPLYRIQSVSVANRNITLDLGSATTLRRVGTPTLQTRGMFMLNGLIDANFTTRGGTIDLNGEGPMGIGVAGRIPNTYGILNASAPVKGLSGAVNAAIYGLRSTKIYVYDTAIINTQESGILLRNCGQCTIERVDFTNIGNCGVEVSITDASVDGGTVPMPDRSYVFVRNCTFTDIEDFGLGTGNACGIQVGGSSVGQGRLSDYDFSGNKYTRCQRAWHIEFLTGTWVEGLTCTDFQADECRQGAFGAIGVRKGRIEGVVRNAGAAPTVALTYDVLSSSMPSTAPSDRYPSIYGAVLSGDVSQLDIDLIVSDNRNQVVVRRTDGAMTAGSAILTSAGASFSAADVGKWVGVLGANPQGVCLVGKIASYQSATQVTLDRPAFTTVSGATFAYGGATREPLIVTNIASADISGTFEGGVSSGLPSEPPPAAVRVRNITDRVSLTNITLTGRGSAATPVGLRIVNDGVFTGKVRPRNYSITGFTDAAVGMDANRAKVEGRFYQSPNGTQIVPSATADTYGASWQANPTGTDFAQVTDLQIDIGGISAAQTVTVEIVGFRYDGLSNTLTVTASANGSIVLTPQQKWQLNQANAPLRAVQLRVKSSVAGSMATATIYMAARE